MLACPVRARSDGKLLVNEGLYFNTNSSIKNGAGSLTTGYIQVMSGYGGIVRQIMYSDTDGGVIYDRTSQNGGSSWGNWVEIVTFDQIPWDIVQTDTPQTFTAAQTFSIAPTITDASKDKGDNQAATMADLKSVETSAWRQLDSSRITFSGDSVHYSVNNFISNADKLCLYRIDSINKRIYISLTIFAPAYNYYIKVDFSSIVSNFTSKGSGHMFSNAVSDPYNGYDTFEFNIKGGNILINISNDSNAVFSGYHNDCWFGYDKLLI